MDVSSAVTGGANPTGAYRSVNHNRNRMYDPVEGRFTSVDPNGLGAVVLGDLAFGGRAIRATAFRPDLNTHYSDGMNTHGAYGAMPKTAQDPTGLLIMGPLDTAMVGMEIGAALGRMMIGYAMNLSDNVDWARDWSARDDEPFTNFDPRGDDLLGGDDEEPGDSTGQMDQAVAGPVGAGRVIGAAGRVSRLMRLRLVVRLIDQKVIFNSYSEARLLTAGLGRRVQVHHIIEQRFATVLGRAADEVPAIIMSRRQHERLTAKLFKELPPNPVEPHGRQAVLRAYRRVYADHPEILAAFEAAVR